MSVQPSPQPEVPDRTVIVARAAFPKGSLAIRVRDELPGLFADEDFASAFGARGRPGISPGQLALVTVLQFAENLTDRQAADAVRGRIDWKYCLGMELDDPGFDFTVLSGFRARLIEHGLEERVLDILLERLSQSGLLRAGGRQRTDSTHVLAAVRTLHRIEFVGETVRATLEALAAAAPDWLATKGMASGEWVKRYGTRVESYRLPKDDDARAELAAAIGRDGFTILEATVDPGAPLWLREIPAVEVLRRVWIQQYQRDQDKEVRWREGKDLPPGRLRVTSPYDTDARYGMKRGSGWNGYKAHLTETCEPDTIHVITHVATTDATTADQEITPVVHHGLAARRLLPDEHDVDAGYTSAELVLASHRDHQVELLGPLKLNPHWQSKDPDAFDLTTFTIDWDAQQVNCPQGAISSAWRTTMTSRGTPLVSVDFRKNDCGPCPQRKRCTASPTGPRKLSFRPRDEHEILERARVEQDTDTWRRRYAVRAGVEGTIHQAVAVTSIRRSRYIGTRKTHLANVFAATALNLIRLDAWRFDARHAPTRTSHLSRLSLSLVA